MARVVLLLQQTERLEMATVNTMEQHSRVSVLERVVEDMTRMRKLVAVQRALLFQLSAAVRRCPHCSGQTLLSRSDTERCMDC